MNIRVSDKVHKDLVTHLPAKIKIGPWVDEAIIEKIEREKTLQTPTLERQNSSNGK